VDLGPRSYEILIGRDLLRRPAEWLRKLPPQRHAVLVADGNTQSYATLLAESLTRANVTLTLIVVPPGERSKSIAVLNRVWEQMLHGHTDRHSTLFAVGGGVVGDVGGFAAATYARGIPFVQVPTSLLAQVDSSVGGKTGINLSAAKNMVGAFWQPQLVVADLDTVNTLPRREFTAGLAEVVKHGVIADAGLFQQLEQLAETLDSATADLGGIIQRCVQIKANIVAADERESTGIRAQLNYGHTIGHALEITLAAGQLLHGEAIAIGMHCAAQIAVARGMLAAEFVPRQQGLLRALGLPTQPPRIDLDRIWEAITHDKKATQDQVSFVLPRALGDVQLVPGIQRDEVVAALRKAGNGAH
jgi:3-dehydroquinate synthase